MFSADNLSGCAPMTVTFTNQSASASPLVDCQWDIEGATNVISDCGQAVYTFQNGGVYDVTLTTTSAIGCTNTMTISDYIYVEDVCKMVGDPFYRFLSFLIYLSLYEPAQFNHFIHFISSQSFQYVSIHLNPFTRVKYSVVST